MNELEKALGRLKELGATPDEMEEYTQEYMRAQGSRPDATSALQRERQNPTGDWEAIPDGLKTAAGIGLSMIPIGGGATAATRAASAGVRRAAPHLAQAAGEKARALGRAGKALFKGPPKPPEGLIGNSMDNVLEVVKAQSKGGTDDVVAAIKRDPRQPIFDALSNEARAVDDVLQQRAPQLGPRLPDVIKVTHRNRTESGRLQQNAPQSRFDWFAERMARRKNP